MEGQLVTGIHASRVRSRAMHGPTSRLPASPVTAIDRALRAAADGDRVHDPARSVFLPVLGTTFDSAEEGYEFYNLYSWDVGFGVRFGRSRTNSMRYRTRQDIVCACSGLGPVELNTTQRTGCRAMVRLLRTDDHGWYVARFEANHNHPLSPSVDERRQWSSHNKIDPVAKDLIRSLRSNNIPVSRLYAVLGSAFGHSSHRQFTRGSLRGLCARMSQEAIVDDIGKTLRILRGMQADDPNLAVCIDSDESCRVRSILWCTGRNRADYACFGDAITFDTTYRTNLYDMPFGLFVGVNNHFQSIVFGAVFLRQETTESFEWAFSTFVDMMQGKAPVTMLTDQCAAMEAAIKSVLPETRHRWCRWHVLRKAKEKLGGVYCKYGGFKREFHDLVTNVLCPTEFENRWTDLVGRYDLGENSYMSRIYDRRFMWAKPYFHGVFCGGMTSTQRSESANHVLKTFIPRSAPMHLFVSKYQVMLSVIAAEEAKEEHVTRQKRRHIRIGVPVEFNAASVYTRVMFDKFSNELYASGSFTVDDADEECVYRVRMALVDDGLQSPVWIVKYSMNQDVPLMECSCGLFEHMAMPCRHMLKVLVHMSAIVIPAGNVHKRWTVTARSASAVHPTIGAGSQLADDDVAGRRNLLYLAAMDLMRDGAVSVEGYKASMKALADVKHALRVMAEDPGHHHPTTPLMIHDGTRNGNADVGDLNLLPPLKVKASGRPATVRLKSRADYYGTKRRKTRGIAECYSLDEVEVPEKISDINMAAGPGKRQAKCGLCGVGGHNRQTCGRK